MMSCGQNKRIWAQAIGAVLGLLLVGSDTFAQVPQFPWTNQRGAPVLVEPKTTDEDASQLRHVLKPARTAAQIAPPINWTPGSLSYWLAGFLFLLFLFLAAMVIYLVAKRTEGPATPTASLNESARRERIRALPFALDEATGDCRESAERARRDGDYRRAMVHLFSHVLIFLDQHQVVRLKRGKTNRQYLEEARGLPEAARYLSQLIDPFEAVFFGNREIPADQFEPFWQALPRFEQVVSQHASQEVNV